MVGAVFQRRLPKRGWELARRTVGIAKRTRERREGELSEEGARFSVGQSWNEPIRRLEIERSQEPRRGVSLPRRRNRIRGHARGRGYVQLPRRLLPALVTLRPLSLDRRGSVRRRCRLFRKIAGIPAGRQTLWRMQKDEGAHATRFAPAAGRPCPFNIFTAHSI